MSADDLDTVPTDDLLTTLCGRFDHAAFVGMKTGVKPGIHAYARRWNGNSHTVIGLIEESKMHVIAELRTRQRDLQESDET